MDLPCAIIPYNMQLRIFLLQLFQPQEQFMDITSIRQNQRIIKYGRQNRLIGHCLNPQSLTGSGLSQPGHGADHPAPGFADRSELSAGINPDLIYFFLSFISMILSANHLLNLQTAAGNFQMGQPVSFFISGNLKYSGTKGFLAHRFLHIAGNPL